MRILFLSHYFPPEGNAPASRVSSMCRRWVEAGHEVTVLTGVPNVPDGVPYAGYRNRWCQEERLDGITVVRVWSFLAANKGSLRRILNYLSFCLCAIWRAWRLPDCDLVVATSPQFFCGWAGVFAARLKRRALVLEIRDIWPESIEAVGALGERGRLRGAALRYLAWLERRLYRAAEHIVAVGDGYRQKLLERGVPAEKISVITNGVERRLFWPRAADAALRAEAGAAREDFLVGYLGTVGMAHGLEVVVEAARLARRRGLARLRFVVVGDGARLAELRAGLEPADADNLCFLGRRPKREMPKWLASVDACLVHLRDSPAFEAVLPSKMFEAAASSRPILLGVRGEARRLLEQLGCGLAFAPEDASGLLRAAQELMEDPQRAAELGRRGHDEVLAGYSLDRLAGRYLELLTRLAPGSRSSPSSVAAGLASPPGREAEASASGAAGAAREADGPAAPEDQASESARARAAAGPSSSRRAG